MTFKTKINGLALCRGSARNMEPLLPEEGKVFVFTDLISAEPVIQCNLTGDETLIYQTFDGIGLKPWVREDGLLMLDDIYLAFSSLNPVTSEKTLDIFYNEKFKVGDKLLSWADAWVEPEGKDIVKSNPLLKKFRKFNKSACIAEGTLIITSNGLKPIEKITQEDKVWNGSSWCDHGGIVFNGIKPTVNFNGDQLTEDHLIEMKTGEWVEVRHVEESKLGRKSPNWKDVWVLVRSIYRSKRYKKS